MDKHLINTGQNGDNSTADRAETFTSNQSRRKKLCRMQDGKMIAGVCIGLAGYLGLSVRVIRAIFLFLVLIGGWGAVAYGAIVLLIPYCGNEKEPSENKTDSIIKPLAIAFASLLIFYSFFGSYSFNVFSAFSVFSKSFILGISLTVIGVFLYRAGDGKSDDSPKTNELKLSRKSIFLGVCGGFAEYLSADKSIIRIVWLTFSFITFGAGFLIYLLIYFNLKGKQ